MKITQYSMQGGFAASSGSYFDLRCRYRHSSFGEPSILPSAEKRQFGSIFAVWMYASLPGVIKTLLGTVVVYAGMAPESFNINNFAPTNLGAFLNPLDTNPALYKLATALDFTTIWSMVLLAIGVAIVAGVKRSSGYIAVFGWWAVIVICSVRMVAIMG